MKKQLGLIAGMAAMFMGSETMHKEKNDLRPEDIDVSKKEPPIPKGCEKFTFDSRFGKFTTVAMSHKSALKKFNVWLEKKENETNEQV